MECSAGWRARPVVLSDDRRCHCCRFAVAHVLLPGMPRCGLGRSLHPRPSPRRGDLKSGPVTLLPAVLAACAFREAGDADSAAAILTGASCHEAHTEEAMN